MFQQFIRRPVLAIIISVVIVFAGSLAIRQLPISQFPQIAPTTVSIFIAYPGSSADVLVKSTLITLENSINGVQGMRYMATDATSAGEATLNIVFEPGTDPNQADIRVIVEWVGNGNDFRSGFPIGVPTQPLGSWRNHVIRPSTRAGRVGRRRRRRTFRP